MSSLVHAVAGAAGGIVAMTATYPLIFISTRAAVETKKEHKSTYQAVLDIIHREGPVGLYAGLSSSLLGIAVTNGVYYYFYERTREAILASPTRPSRSRALGTLESMLSSLIAGTATTLISNPIWVTQVTQATQTLPSENVHPSAHTSESRKLSMGQTVRFILRKDGVSAFWRGIGPALVLVINPILQYTVFEQLKNVLIKRRTSKLKAATSAAATVAMLSDLDFFWLGALSKLIATTLTYPYIVLKSRLQANSAQSRAYTSSIDGMQKILREEGLQGLYRGVGSKLVQSVLTAAILFAGQRRIYEIVSSATAPVLAKTA
ncbi:mitochondrial carrier [Ramaria rubella]|nr:mitochondrial carrier [Ramaria rubella]